MSGTTASPVPRDDGACDHLLGMEIPPLVRPSTQGPLDLAELAAATLALYVYPRTGVPGEPPLPDWDLIPGALGCTAQSCAFRDRSAEVTARGAWLAGLSAQSLEEQREFAARNEIPFPLVSDPDLHVARALGLPTFTAAGLTLYRRVTLIAEGGRIVKVFYPVFPPELNAVDVLAWLDSRREHATPRPRT